MSEMVERVVAAMEARSLQEPCTIEDVARAAIEAMREPTLDMLQDGHRAAGKTRIAGAGGMTLEACIQRETAREYAAWRAMISAALPQEGGER